MSRGLSELQRWLLGCLRVRTEALHTTVSLLEQAQLAPYLMPSKGTYATWDNRDPATRQLTNAHSYTTIWRVTQAGREWDRI